MRNYPPGTRAPWTWPKQIIQIQIQIQIQISNRWGTNYLGCELLEDEVDVPVVFRAAVVKHNHHHHHHYQQQHWLVLLCIVALSIIFMIASNAFEADNSSHQLIHSNHISIPMLHPAFQVRGFPVLSHLSCDLLPGLDWLFNWKSILPGLDWLFNWKSISLWFSIGCQVISNFHFILNDQHLVIVIFPIIWGKHLVLFGSFEESTLFYLVYLKEAPCFTWFIWRKHLVLLGSLFNLTSPSPKSHLFAA